MNMPPTAVKLHRALTGLEQWRNAVRQSLIDSLDTDTYAVPDALVVLSEAHEQAKNVIARYLLNEYQTTEALSNPDEDDNSNSVYAA